MSVAEVADVATQEYLPRPPGRNQKYEYFGKPRRWVFAYLLVAAIGILYGYVHVAEHAWVVAPLMWLLLMLMVPPAVVNFWLRIGPPRLTLAEHQATVASYRESGERVDVFLPSCGESLALLDNTFHYVSLLRWSGTKIVYVLDDSTREQVKELAGRYGFRYIVRPDPGEMKKAGNLLHALGVSDGDFIAVIDADFAVRADFLYETMPYFADPAVGIVQTAQCFDVSDPSFPYIQRYAGTLQNIFFRFIQPARDRYKAAICAGTNLVYRRSAVEAAGGFAQVPIGEDVHSGVKLWWAGYETRYLQLCLARGVAPVDFPSLANQQARWCRSSMLLMVDKHFVEAQFTWQQRAAFWAAFLYYMSSAALLITGPFPALDLLHDLVLPGADLFRHNYPPMLLTLAATPSGSFSDAQPRLAANDLSLVPSSTLLFPRVRGVVRGPRALVEWVPTGASPRAGRVPRDGGTESCASGSCSSRSSFWSGLRAPRARAPLGWRPFWATELLGGVQLVHAGAAADS